MNKGCQIWNTSGVGRGLDGEIEEGDAECQFLDKCEDEYTGVRVLLVHYMHENLHWLYCKVLLCYN